MGEIGVHLEDGLETVVQRPPKACEVGPTQSLLGEAMQDVYPRFDLAHPIGQISGPVRRIVVDDQDLDARILSQDGRDDLGEVGSLVVGRHDDQYSFNHAPASSR